METEGVEMETSVIEERGEEDNDQGEDGEEASEEEEESPFSDRNRWKRGGIIDPDADDW
jgi:hypothetical protein